jgi:hypothetical protein
MVMSVANVQGTATKIDDEAVSKLRPTPGTGRFWPRSHAIHPGYPAIGWASGTADVIDAVDFAGARYRIVVA